jgi:putative addiction module component (TIGR02574 family)
MSRRLADVTSEAHDLLHSALALPAGDRAEMAAVLLESLDGDLETAPDFDEEWLAEIAERARRVLNGDSEGTPWEEVRQQVRAQVAARARAR